MSSIAAALISHERVAEERKGEKGEIRCEQELGPDNPCCAGP